MNIYDSQEWKDLEAAADKAWKDEAKARKAFEKADNKLSVSDPKLAKARTKYKEAGDAVAAVYKAMREMLDKYNA